MMRAEMMTMTEPRASAMTWSQTPRMFMLEALPPPWEWPWPPLDFLAAGSTPGYTIYGGRVGRRFDRCCLYK